MALKTHDRIERDRIVLRLPSTSWCDRRRVKSRDECVEELQEFGNVTINDGWTPWLFYTMRSSRFQCHLCRRYSSTMMRHYYHYRRPWPHPKNKRWSTETWRYWSVSMEKSNYLISIQQFERRYHPKSHGWCHLID